MAKLRYITVFAFMMSSLHIALLLYGYLFSGLLVYLTDRGMQWKFQLAGLFIAMLILLLYGLLHTGGAYTYLDYGLLTLPLFSIALFNGLGWLSWKLRKKPFLAQWRGSRNLYAEEATWADRFLSFLFILSELAWPIGVLFLLSTVYPA